MPKGNGKPIPTITFSTIIKSTAEQDLRTALETRFKEHTHRHPNISWEEVEKKLDNKDLLITLYTMESTGGEPDVIDVDARSGRYLWVDCSPQSPLRRSICYDQAGQDQREKKGIFPAGNAIELAKEMGIEVMDETTYRMLQEIEEVDTKTGSWIQTPQEIRELGGALFMERRYNTVFVGHNGAQSFYSDRGFRGMIWA